jgi:heat shock protein HslJ
VKRTIPALLFASMLASCAYFGAGNGNASTSPTPPDPGTSAGTPEGSWILTQGTSASGEIPVTDDHPITLVIDADKVGGHAACNIYGGTVAISGNAMHLSAMSMTQMACADDQAMNAEAAYMAALDAVTEWARDGDQLVLSGDGVELTFGLQPPVPDADIVGTTWVLDTLMQGDTASTILGEATLALAADGTFIASTGCRELAGSFAISGDAIEFSDATATGECSDELQAQDALVRDVLDGHVTATVDASILTLIGNDRQGLGYHAAPDVE